MKVILFGATGMIGQAALRECLLDPGVTAVLSIGRSTTGQQHPKLRQLVHSDLTALSSIETELSGYDACFYCLGISSVGMTEAAYRKITYDMPLAAGETLARLNPGMTFILTSASGADSTEKGSVMWARVKGAAENAVMRMPLKAYAFRPFFVQPLNGIGSKTKLYAAIYAFTSRLAPVLMWLMPNYATTTTEIGRAMIGVARNGAPTKILESRAIRQAAATAG